MNTALYYRTPSVKILGNQDVGVREIAYFRHPDSPSQTDERITYFSVNQAGFLSQSLSPRQYDLQQQNSEVPSSYKAIHSLNGQIIHIANADKGEEFVLNDIENRPAISINPNNVKRIWKYEDSESLGRPLKVTETSKGKAERVVEYFEWAGNSQLEKNNNLAGNYKRHFHTAGVSQTDSIALTQVTLIEKRQLLTGEPDADWQIMDDTLLSEVFTMEQISDATGMILLHIDAHGRRQRDTYNIAAQLKSRSLQLAGKTEEQVVIRALFYNATGQVEQEIAGNGVATSYTYEPETQRLIGIKTERPAGHISGAAILQDLRYSFDPVGNIINVRNDAEITRFWRNQKTVPENTYHYDSLYQLVRATGREMASICSQYPLSSKVSSLNEQTYTNYTRTYRYDRGNNLTRIQHNAPATGNSHSTELTVSSRSNRAVLSTLTTNPNAVEGFFDAAGNQLQLLPGHNISWNSRDELQQVILLDRNSVSMSDREWYRYDAHGQRAIKATYLKQGNSQRYSHKIYLSGLEKTTVYQDDKKIESYDRILLGHAQLLHWEQGLPSGITNDSIRYSHGDQIGSCNLETDKDGLLISHEEFYPFGETAVWLVRNNVEAEYKTYRYSGKERDATGLYYYGFRYYQSWIGRWLSADPAGTVDGLNLFRMVRNNPTTFEDNNGLITSQEAVVEDYYTYRIKPAILARKERDEEEARNKIQTITGESGQVLGERHQQVLSRIENTRLTLNIRPETVKLLNTSSQVKNVYQIKNRSSEHMEKRDKLERVLFDIGGNNLTGFDPLYKEAYRNNYDTPGHARQKYGALSFDEAAGKGGAPSYGPSVLYLDEKVKMHVTVTPFDTYDQFIHKGTPIPEFQSAVSVWDNLHPLIAHANEPRTDFLLNTSTGEPSRYFEWQSYTPITFASDIESFRLNSDSKVKYAKTFTKNNNIGWLDKPKGFFG